MTTSTESGAAAGAGRGVRQGGIPDWRRAGERGDETIVLAQFVRTLSGRHLKHKWKHVSAQGKHTHTHTIAQSNTFNRTNPTPMKHAHKQTHRQPLQTPHTLRLHYTHTRSRTRTQHLPKITLSIAHTTQPPIAHAHNGAQAYRPSLSRPLRQLLRNQGHQQVRVEVCGMAKCQPGRGVLLASERRHCGRVDIVFLVRLLLCLFFSMPY